MSRTIVVIPAAGLLAVLLAVCGCEKAAQTPAGQSGTQRDTAADLDALRSLPYAGGYTTSEDEVGGVVFRDEERSCPGYNLYCVQDLSMAELIDEDGTPVNSWSYSPSLCWQRAELLPNGDLLAVGADPSVLPDGQPAAAPADDARYVLRLDWEGRLLWKKMLCAHHDIEVTPTGKLLALTFERRLVPSVDPDVKVRDGQLTLLNQDGTVIKSNSMLRAVSRSADVFPLESMGPVTVEGRRSIDLFHTNSIEWMRRKRLVGRHPLYDLSNILVCFRHQDRVAVLNWVSNEIVWAWGLGELSGPHDAHVLDNGHILLFDNGLVPKRSRAVEVDPLTGEIVWQYQGDPPASFYTMSKGSVQRLPNGNTLIAESDKGRAIEVTPDKEVVWEFICPHKVSADERAAIVRIKRFSHEFIDAISETQ